jgi:hypothetical protein
MPGVGIGGLLSDVIGGGDQNAQLARLISGQGLNPAPNPNPAPGSPSGAPGGASAAPGGGQSPATAPAPGQAPPATYAPDPQNSAVVEALLKVHQQDLAASGLNRSLAGMAAAFGTAQQQKSKMENLDAMSGPQDDTLGALKSIMGIQGEAFKQDQAKKFAAGAAGYAKMLGISPEDAQGLAGNPELMGDLLKTHFASQLPTEHARDVESYGKEYAASMGYDPDPSKWSSLQRQDVESAKANMYAGAMGGNDLEQRQYMQEKQGGLTTDDYATWKAKHAAAATTMQTQAKDVQDFKDTAIQDYTGVHTKLTQNEALVDQLLKDPKIALAVLKSPDFLTTGKIAGNIPGWVPLVGRDDDIKKAALALNQLRAGLTGESLSNVKNVRNIREFNTLGQAATGGLDAVNTEAGLQQALQNIKTKFLDAHATAEMAAGHKLTGELVGHGNRDLLDKNNPYYNGATEEAPATISGPEDIAKLPTGTAFIIPSGPNKGRIGYAP